MIEMRIEGRAIYLKLSEEISKEHRLELEHVYQQILNTQSIVLILDISSCKKIEEYCLRPLVQLQANIRMREGGNIYIIGARPSLRKFLLIKGAVRESEIYQDMKEMKQALLA